MNRLVANTVSCAVIGLLSMLAMAQDLNDKQWIGTLGDGPAAADARTFETARTSVRLPFRHEVEAIGNVGPTGQRVTATALFAAITFDVGRELPLIGILHQGRSDSARITPLRDVQNHCPPALPYSIRPRPNISDVAVLHAVNFDVINTPRREHDYDSLEIGNGINDGLTPVERETQISLWALGASPFILGIDLTHLDPTDLQKYLKNTDVLAVDQDSIAAKRVLNNGNQQVFAKTEPNGDAIVGLFNTGGKSEEVSVPASTVGLPENKGGYSLHDLWTGERNKTGSTISAVVPSHGVVLYRIKRI